MPNVTDFPPRAACRQAVRFDRLFRFLRAGAFILGEPKVVVRAQVEASGFGAGESESQMTKNVNPFSKAHSRDYFSYAKWLSKHIKANKQHV